MNLRKIRNPELFQGTLQKKHYFEGWYFKFVTEDTLQTMAFIPGISLEPEDSHCFVQVIQSPNTQTYYFKYPVSDFKATDSPFSIKVGENYFSMESCHIALSDEFQSSPQGISFNGDFQISGLTPIRTSWLMPNIMGFFAYLPFMECNHGVLSMNHYIKGRIELSGEKLLEFTGGKGYIEKDWGASFPSKYIWIQSNHFEDVNNSFMCSIATIPFGLFSFQGLIANLIIEGVEYRFATYNFAKVKNLIIQTNTLSFDLIKGPLTLTCEARINESGALLAPHKGEMLRTIKEGLSGSLILTLKENGKPPRTFKSTSVGIEIVD